MNNKKSKVSVFFKDRRTVEKECEVWANKIVKSYKPDLVVFWLKVVSCLQMFLDEYVTVLSSIFL